MKDYFPEGTLLNKEENKILITNVEKDIKISELNNQNVEIIQNQNIDVYISQTNADIPPSIK